MVKNIIFDLGNVLLEFRPKEYLRKKISDELKVSELYREIYQSEEWVMLDRGVITEEEATRALIGRSRENGELISLAFDSWYDMLAPMPDTIDILGKLKKAGYRLYYLSNYQLLAFENVCGRNDFFKLFDGGIVSFKEKLVKPEEGIYKLLIERYGITPGESIFIDDTDVNIDAAKLLGFNSILFKDAGDLREKLEIYGIEL